MAITSQMAVERALHKLLPPGANPTDAARLRAQLPVHVRSALAKLGKYVAKANPESMQKEITFTAASGKIDLTTVNASNNVNNVKLLFDPLRSQVYVGTNRDPAVYIERIEVLKNGGLPNDTYYYSQRGNTLYFLNTDNATNTLTGTIIVVTNYIPDIDEVNPDHEETLIDLIADLASTGMDKAANKMDALESATAGRA